MFLSVGKLRELISGLSDTTVVLIPEHDHAYREATAEVVDVYFMRRAQRFYENHGPEYKSSPSDVALKALVIS